jgi:hypothetical protein
MPGAAAAGRQWLCCRRNAAAGGVGRGVPCDVVINPNHFNAL